MLWRALKSVERGYYVDIGAQDPKVDSVSMGLYELGWRGVHVEPTPAYANALRLARPDETVVQVAIGTEAALIPFYEIPDTGISTGDPAIAKQHEAAGYANRRIDVACITLCTLFERLPARDIHWLKIDVEGMEEQVLRSWAPSPVRPWIVVIESTRPRTSEPSFAHWEPVILELGYRFAYSDGLNRFYVSAEHQELLAAFTTPPGVFDAFSLSGMASNGFTYTLNQALEKDRQRIAELNAAYGAIEARLNTTYAEQQVERAAAQMANHEVTALRARLAEVDAWIAAEKLKTDARLDETLAHAKRAILSLQHMTAARDETSQQLQAAQKKDEQRVSDLALRRDENQALERSLAEREAEVLQLGAELAASHSNAAHLRNELTRRRESSDPRFIMRAVLSKSPLRGLLGRADSQTFTLPTTPPAMTDQLTRGSQTSPEASVAFLLTQFDLHFVRDAYALLLGREVDPTGLETYLTKLRQGVTRQSIIVDIARSEEARQLGRELAGLDELVREEEANKPNLARRMQHRLAGDSTESLARMVRSLENRTAVLNSDLDTRLQSMQSALSNVETVVTEGEKANAAWRSIQQTEALDSLRLMSKTAETHRHLQDELFHRLKAAVKR